MRHSTFDSRLLFVAVMVHGLCLSMHGKLWANGVDELKNGKQERRQPMGAEQSQPGIIRLRLSDQPSGATQRRLLGVFVIDRDGKIQAEAAEPYLSGFLNQKANSINKRGEVAIPAAPPPGTNPRANVSRLVKSSDPGFVDALIESLKWSGISAERIEDETGAGHNAEKR